MWIQKGKDHEVEVDEKGNESRAKKGSVKPGQVKGRGKIEPGLRTQDQTHRRIS